MRNVARGPRRLSLTYLLAIVMILSIPFVASAATRRRAPLGWLGMDVSRAVTPQGTAVLRVESLLPQSAARRAGVRQGDVIEQIDGRAVTFQNDRQFLDYWLTLVPGQQVTLSLVNANQHRREVVTVDRFPRELQHDWLRMYDETTAREQSAGR